MTKKMMALVVGAALVAAGCASNSDSSSSADPAPIDTTDQVESTDPPATDPPATDPPATDPPADDPGADGVINVPDEFATVQEAVDAAAEGDLILIAPGTYVEAVDVTTDNLTIRGLDRDGVVFDGELELDNAIRILGADGVTVENLTTMNYAFNGVFWIESEGYRASYITTYRTGDYGIYAFDSVKGQIENSHTVGSRDAGVYIGQCYPCDAVVDNVTASHNGLGYSGTNSGGNLLIVNSVWHENRAGIVPNSGSYELCYPERETTIVGNLVYDNNAEDSAGIGVSILAQRNGIVVAGGIRNVIERNRVDNHKRTGIVLIPFPESTPNDDLPTKDEWDTSCEEKRQEPPVIPEEGLIEFDGAELMLWNPFENRIIDNVVTNSIEADIAVDSIGVDLSTLGNCWSGNEAELTAPSNLQELAPCDGEGSGGDWAAGGLEAVRWLIEIDTMPPEVDWKIAPLPELGEHENMPDAATAPAAPAIDVPYAIDLNAITVPELPES